MSAATSNRHILLFAGQGSNQHLANPAGVRVLRELLREAQLEAFQSFLQQCRDAFHIELDSATQDEQSILGDGFRDSFQDPDSFLSPPEAFRSHPVVETLSLYVHQVLELMTFQSHNECKTVVETSGICTGVLPAVLAASFISYSSSNFVTSAVELFRLAFWIGLRAALTSRRISGEDWQKTAWLLSVFGVPLEGLEHRLDKWKKAKESESNNEHHNLRISGIFNNKNMSICGPSSSLNDIKSSLTAENIDCRWANVHAIYHGGSEMQDTLQQTVADIERRGIQFPTWDLLHVPLRSATDGARSCELKSQRETLLNMALRSIFIDMVDWRATSDMMYNSHLKMLDNGSNSKLRLTGVGPGSRILLHSFRDLPSDPMLDKIENWAEYMSLPSADDIAIVGLSVNYPGGSGTEGFWEVIKNGISTVKEIPTSRFDISRLKDKDKSAKSKKSQFIPRHGNFLDAAFDFDASYFNISPREAKSMDPQQRLLLHAALDALEDAGYSPDASPSFQRDTFGVYTGVATGDYVDNLRDDIDVYYSPGTLRAFLSGRISYAFKFKGPSMVIDTACSSSMVALYHACMALKSGECTAALALGVNTVSSPDMYSGLGRAHFLSPTGQCKPFDEGADGYCRAEGCGSVVVKRLSDAVAEGDHIYGVIRGIGTNQCGTAKSITHPHAGTQEDLFRSVLKRSRVSPNSISVVEAHGTGTQAGDYTEVSSVEAVFGKRPSETPLYLSSVKGNIGHAEAASGLAGLAKLLLMMENKKLLPQASHNKLSHRLDGLMSGGKLRIPTQLEDWHHIPGQFSRRALLNNFGASGSNVALVLEEYNAPRVRGNQLINDTLNPSRSHHVLNLSAKNDQALSALVTRYISYLTKDSSISIEDVCYSTNARRQHLSPANLSIVASNSTDLIQRLSEVKVIDTPIHPTSPKKIIFSFSGQGDVRIGMGAGLLSTCPDFRKTVDECDKLLSDNGFSPVSAFLSNCPVATNTPGIEEDVIISQSACFIQQYALAKLWMSWGVVPDLIVGHSIGEYAAFAISGALSLKEALLLVATRARLMVEQCAASTTGMMACRMPVAVATNILSENSGVYQDVTISCYNSPQDVVLGGPITSLTKFASYCKTEGIKHKVLQVPYAFHTPSLDPILDGLAKASARVGERTPLIQIGSSLFGRLLESEARLGSDYFVRHAREPVNFSGLVSDINNWSAGSHLTFLEIGPSGSTESMFKSGISGRSYNFLSSLRPSQSSWATLAPALQKLSQLNHPIDWRAVYRGTSAKFLRSLPRYPLNKSTYFIPFKFPQTTAPSAGTSEEDKQVQAPTFAFLSELPESGSTDSTATFTTPMKQISRFVKAHTVGGAHLCPASVYMEVVLQAAAHQGAIDGVKGVCVFDNVAFEHPLVYTEQTENTAGIQTQMDIRASGDGWQFSSTSKAKQVYCTGRIRSDDKSSQATTDLLRRKLVQVERLKRSFSITGGRFTQTFSTRTIYNMIFPRVVEYTEPYLTLRHLTISESGLEGHGAFRLESLNSESNGRFITSPAFVDTLLHAAGFVANTYVPSDIACICVNLEQALINVDTSELYDRDLQVYCCIGDIGSAFIADAYALTPEGTLVAYVEGMCFKKIKLKSFKAILARSTTQAPGSGATKTVNTPQRPIHTKTEDMSNGTVQKGVPSTKLPIRNSVISTIRGVCGLHDDPPTSSSLEELGVDSLLIIELVEALRKEFTRTDFFRVDVENCKTVEELINSIIDASEADDVPAEATPMQYTNSSSTAVSNGETMTTFPDAQDALATIIKSVFMDVCGVDPTSEMNHKLSFLGVDSLMSIELAEGLRARLEINIDDGHGDISELTYQQLEELCLAQAPTENPTPSASENGDAIYTPAETPKKQVVILEESNEEKEGKFQCLSKLLKTTPTENGSLYMFHDGSGLSKMYSRLANMNRNVYGICNLSSPSSVPCNAEVQTMEELASWYITHASLAAQSDIILGGWSFGGVLAFEVSRQLRRKGITVKGVVLLDAPVPKDHEALPREIVSYVLSQQNISSRINKGTGSDAVKKARACIEGQFHRHARMLQNYSPESQHDDVPCVIIKCTQNIDTMGLCEVEYPYLSSSESRDQSTREWEDLTGHRIPVLEVDCNHFEVFASNNVDNVSKKLEVACKLLESSII